MDEEVIEEVPSISFYEIFVELNNYYQQTGSFTVPLNHPVMPFILDGLTAMCMEGLLEERWNDRMQQLAAFKAHHGHCNTSMLTTDHDLDRWVHRQRGYYKLYEEQEPNPLTEARFERLKGVGLCTAPNKWEQRYEELKRFQLENGHADPPIDYPKLGIWCLNQRFNLENMPQYRIDKLDELGFTWNYNTRSSNDEVWNEKYELLQEYIRENGHPNVPKSNEPLSCWVRKQRYEYSKFIKKKKSQITRDRIDKLNAVGFSFRLRADTISFEQRLEDLVQFKQQHGHFNIPRNHPTLGSWSVYTKTQIKHFLDGRASSIDQAKADKLISIGFLDIASQSSPHDMRIPILPRLPHNEQHGVMNAHEYNWDDDYSFRFNQS